MGGWPATRSRLATKWLASSSWRAMTPAVPYSASNCITEPIVTYSRVTLETEAHVCAGHAVAVGKTDGCLQCHIERTGAPDLTVVEWPAGADPTLEEPACGAHYQPYGPVELAFVTAMISEVALDCLLDPPKASFSRVGIAAPRRLEALGGQLTRGWRSEFGVGNGGSRTVNRPWTAAACAACGPDRLDEAV